MFQLKYGGFIEKKKKKNVFLPMKNNYFLNIFLTFEEEKTYIRKICLKVYYKFLKVVNITNLWKSLNQVSGKQKPVNGLN